MPNSKREYSDRIVLTPDVSLKYLLFLPSQYVEQAEKKCPLILFLHGAGERGDDLALLERHGIPKVVNQRPDFQFLTASPQCPENSWWTHELLIERLVGLLDVLQENRRIDPARIYLTGLSMGGYGTWALSERLPDRFAAIAPVCGGGDPEKAPVIRHIPAWIFHGARDEVVVPEESESMYEALLGCGGDVKYTVYRDAAHDSWTATYDNDELYHWFPRHCRPERSSGSFAG